MSDHRLINGFVVAAGLTSVALAGRSLARSSTRVVPEGGINEGFYLTIGGVKQWISIYGEDIRIPFFSSSTEVQAERSAI